MLPDQELQHVSYNEKANGKHELVRFSGETNRSSNSVACISKRPTNSNLKLTSAVAGEALIEEIDM